MKHTPTRMTYMENKLIVTVNVELDEHDAKIYKELDTTVARMIEADETLALELRNILSNYGFERINGILWTDNLNTMSTCLHAITSHIEYIQGCKANFGQVSEIVSTIWNSMTSAQQVAKMTKNGMEDLLESVCSIIGVPMIDLDRFKTEYEVLVYYLTGMELEELE